MDTFYHYDTSKYGGCNLWTPFIIMIRQNTVAVTYDRTPFIIMISQNTVDVTYGHLLSL